MEDIILLNRIQKLSKAQRKELLSKLNASIADNEIKPTSAAKKLFCYVTTHSNKTDVSSILSSLKGELPDYMIPSKVNIIKEMPLLPNGKINKIKLARELKSRAFIENKVDDANSSAESKLIRIWEEVLNVRPVLKDDNFFEIGGDSILSIQIISKARKLGMELSANQLFQYQTIAELAPLVALGEKSSSVEEKLTRIWEEVLNVRPVRKDDNFFEIGGDSILSIQIISKARKLGMELSANQLFQHQTIAELCSVVSRKNGKRTKESIVTGPVTMTPIQHWFFETHKNAPQAWNQGYKISGIPHTSASDFEKIVTTLVLQHDSLRSSFKQTNGVWTRHLLDPKEINALDYVSISNSADTHRFIENRLSSFQKELELSKGNLFKCFYFKATEPENSVVVLLAHHLLVDAVSWQIIREDFNTLIADDTAHESLFLNKTSSMNDWGNYLNDQAYSSDFTSEIPFWQKQTNGKSNLVLDTIVYDRPILENSIQVLKFTLNKEKTAQLLGAANKKYGTKINELLLAGLTYTICQWCNTNYLNLGMEGHGRETNDLGLDLSHTVGWFTSYFPIKLEFKNQDIGLFIKSVKEQLRKIPNKGLGYGVLKYNNTKLEVDSIPNYSPEVLFNYLGVQHLKKKQGDPFFLTEALDHTLTRDEMSEREYLFEINTFIKNDILNVHWSYSHKIHHSDTIKGLIRGFEENMGKIITNCLIDDNQVYTPSDFPEVDLNQDDLDHLLDSL